LPSNEPEAAPPFFDNAEIRRSDLAWNDWPEVAAFLGDQAVCRIAVSDDPSPYVSAQSYRFDGSAFLVHFSRSGRLAGLLQADPRISVEVSQAVSLLKAPYAQNTSMEYRSVLARCRAHLSLFDLDIEEQQYEALEKYRPERDYLPIDRERATRRIVAVRAEIVTLSAKKRILADGQTGPGGVDPGYARYAFPPPPALSSLPPEAFEPR
jgi:nitroimidazol reductase NimA-like FMN-containing flavoprotein (pyridoxamine 5'-phosphate oxidase superfamily)